MMRHGLVRYVLMPVLGLEAFVLAVQLLDADRHSILFSENGFVELGTAACFLLAAGLALQLAFAHRELMPHRYRLLFVLFAMTACFVALEEMSYGQHIFGWRGPEFFAQYSSKHELNLHNLYGDWLSNVMRQIANVAFPTCCIILPLSAMRSRRQFDPNHWCYYLLPKTELIAIILLAQVLSPLDKLSKWLVGVSMLVRPGEVQELFWSMGAAVYVWVIKQRILTSADESDVVAFRPLFVDQSEMREAA
jgi:hypothetical protein